MRIVLLLAVLFVAAWLPTAMAAGLPDNTSYTWHHDTPEDRIFIPQLGRYRDVYAEKFPDPYEPVPIKLAQAFLVQQNKAQDCCPSMHVVTEITNGRDRDKTNVVVMKNNITTQYFYEIVCLPGVEGKPCRFAERNLMKQTRCVQVYSYSYAMVHNVNDEKNPRLDYIRVKMGCSCHVSPKKIRHHHKGQQRKRKND